LDHSTGFEKTDSEAENGKNDRRAGVENGAALLEIKKLQPLLYYLFNHSPAALTVYR